MISIGQLIEAGNFTALVDEATSLGREMAGKVPWAVYTQTIADWYVLNTAASLRLPFLSLQGRERGLSVCLSFFADYVSSGMAGLNKPKPITRRCKRVPIPRWRPRTQQTATPTMNLTTTPHRRPTIPAVRASLLPHAHWSPQSVNPRQARPKWTQASVRKR